MAAVRTEVGGLVDNVLAAIRRENDVYAEVLEGPEGVAIRLGVEEAIKAFLTAVERGQPPSRGTAELWQRLGEAEFQAGRSLEALRAAFRTGIRAAWRGAAELAVRAGISPQLVITLAEAIFVYSDELASDVVEGYVRVQSDEAGERQRRRRRLAALLVDPAGHDPETILHAAELARWPLPRTVAALVLAPGGEARAVHPDALVGAEDWLLFGDPEGPGREAELRHRLEGQAAALGPAVGWRDAERSLRWARLTLELAALGVLPSGQPVRSCDHLPALIIHQDPALAGELAGRRLAPLGVLPSPERERLEETLRAWLDHQRHTPAVAAQLHVHAQTVRYRMGRLRELLGDSLATAEGRFELELALRVRRPLPERAGETRGAG